MLKVKQVLHDFFDASFMGVPDTRFLPDLRDWGQETIMSGVEVIRDRIYNTGYGCPGVMKLGPDHRLPLGITDLGCMEAFQCRWRMESAFSWFLEETGTKISDTILVRLLRYPEYDIAVIAASLLNLNTHETERIVPSLLDAFKFRKGTAFRLASAMTLRTHNVKEPLAEVAIPYLIPSMSSVDEITEEEKLKRKEEFLTTDPDPDQISDYILDNVGSSLTRFLSRVEKIITWDIATKGKGPRSKWPEWWIRQ
jgi:hypothetical protein